jgi:hypothetical protein
MADRDWAKELAKIDKQLESISDEALLPAPAPAAPAAPAAPGKGKGAPAKPAAKAEVPTDVAAARARTTTLGVMLRLLLAVLLGVAMLFWPYEARCGLGLAGYLGAVGAVVIAGGWSAVWSWRHRAGKAHVLSLLLVVWGLVLASMEVLPRVGYAKPDVSRPATWSCS